MIRKPIRTYERKRGEGRLGWQPLSLASMMVRDDRPQTLGKEEVIRTNARIFLDDDADDDPFDTEFDRLARAAPSSQPPILPDRSSNSSYTSSSDSSWKEDRKGPPDPVPFIDPFVNIEILRSPAKNPRNKRRKLDEETVTTTAKMAEPKTSQRLQSSKKSNENAEPNSRPANNFGKKKPGRKREKKSLEEAFVDVPKKRKTKASPKLKECSVSLQRVPLGSLDSGNSLDESEESKNFVTKELVDGSSLTGSNDGKTLLKNPVVALFRLPMNDRVDKRSSLKNPVVALAKLSIGTPAIFSSSTPIVPRRYGREGSALRLSPIKSDERLENESENSAPAISSMKSNTQSNFMIGEASAVEKRRSEGKKSEEKGVKVYGRILSITPDSEASALIFDDTKNSNGEPPSVQVSRSLQEAPGSTEMTVASSGLITESSGHESFHLTYVDDAENAEIRPGDVSTLEAHSGNGRTSTIDLGTDLPTDSSRNENQSSREWHSSADEWSTISESLEISGAIIEEESAKAVETPADREKSKPGKKPNLQPVVLLDRLTFGMFGTVDKGHREIVDANEESSSRNVHEGSSLRNSNEESSSMTFNEESSLRNVNEKLSLKNIEEESSLRNKEWSFRNINEESSLRNINEELSSRNEESSLRSINEESSLKSIDEETSLRSIHEESCLRSINEKSSLRNDESSLRNDESSLRNEESSLNFANEDSSWTTKDESSSRNTNLENSDKFDATGSDTENIKTDDNRKSVTVVEPSEGKLTPDENGNETGEEFIHKESTTGMSENQNDKRVSRSPKSYTEVHEVSREIESPCQPVVLLTRLEDPFRVTKRRNRYRNWDLKLTAISERINEKFSSHLEEEIPEVSGRGNPEVTLKEPEVNRGDSGRELTSVNSVISAGATTQLLQEESSISALPEISQREDKVVFLKPGKSWARSLSILNQVHSEGDFEYLAAGKGRKWRESVQSLLGMQQQGHLQSCVRKNEDYNELRLSSGVRNSLAWIPGSSQPNTSRLLSIGSPGRFIRRVSIRVLPDRKSYRQFKDTPFLQAYGISPIETQESDPQRSTLLTSPEKCLDIVRSPVTKVKYKDVVLAQCGQEAASSFENCYPEEYLDNCRKIGEGVYGEVFLHEKDSVKTVIKIIPIEGETRINGERQKKFDEILSEIVIAKQLHNLRFGNVSSTSSFVEVKNVRCVAGKYPSKLIDLWKKFDEEKRSENDCPDIFEDDQLYIVLELGHGGEDLEAYVFQNALEAHALFMQAAVALAVAEETLEFEHRDLHWGNLLISRTEVPQIEFRLNEKPISLTTKGVKASVIDFTLSRMSHEGCSIFNDLSMDEDLFVAQGEYQFDIYRLMRKRLDNDWQRFEPYTNVLWLHYLLDKMITAVRYRRKTTKVHKNGIAKLQELKDEILAYESAKDFVTNCDKATRLKTSRTSVSST